MNKIHSFTAKVIKNIQLTPDVIQLSITKPENFEFKAGQFVTIFLTKDEKKIPRSYSILSQPSQKEHLDLCIKIVENGFASTIFKETKINDEFYVKGPFGHFVFDTQTKNDHVFIGAGTGLVPFYSMIKELLPTTKSKFKLIFGTKTQKDLLFHQEFIELQNKYPHFSYFPTLSREDWDGAKGHVQEHITGDLQNKTFYICGLKELVLETKELLLSREVKPENIKFERYS